MDEEKQLLRPLQQPNGSWTRANEELPLMLLEAVFAASIRLLAYKLCNHTKTHSIALDEHMNIFQKVKVML